MRHARTRRGTDSNTRLLARKQTRAEVSNSGRILHTPARAKAPLKCVQELSRRGSGDNGSYIPFCRTTRDTSLLRLARKVIPASP
jgi:hypothetical protein